MNDQQGRTIPSRPIPKRPSVQPGQSLSPPKRSFLLSESSQSVSAPLPPESEQAPVLAAPSAAQSEDVNSDSSRVPILAAPSSDDVDVRSSFAEMATVKRVALAPKALLEGKSRPSPYPAIVSRPASRLKVSAERRSRPKSTPYPAMISSKRGRKW